MTRVLVKFNNNTEIDIKRAAWSALSLGSRMRINVEKGAS